MKLVDLALTEDTHSRKHLAMQETIMGLFTLPPATAFEVLEFALGERDWEDLDDVSRERLYAHYEKTLPYGTTTARVSDPYRFVGRALRHDLGL